MALVSKILEATLTAGSTTVTFTDSDIPNSLIRVFSSNSDIIPESRTLSVNTLTVTYAPQSNNIDVAVEIVKQGLDIVDNVLSEDTDKALSAKQGYLLSAAIGDVSDGLSTLSETVNNLDIPDNITDLDDVTVTDIQSGQVLAWDGVKFVNVDQSGGGSGISYSTTEQDTGIKWTDNKTIYQKTFELASGTITGNVINVGNVSGIDKVIKSECTCIQTNNSRQYSLPMIRVNASENIYKNVYVDNSTLYMQIISGTAYVLNTIKFTVWYTKN